MSTETDSGLNSSGNAENSNRSQAGGQWISVEERMPTWADCWKSKIPGIAEMLPTVMVWDAGWGTQYECTYDPEEGFEPLYDREPPDRITHWSALLSPPASKGEKR